MATGLLGWLKITAGVLAVPIFGFAVLAAVGQRVAEAEGGNVTLASPEEVRARIRSGRAAFRALTPAQHLSAARSALAQGYDPARGTGGDFFQALRHLCAIPEGTPEAVAVADLRAEVGARRARAVPLVAPALAARLASPAPPGESPACRRRDIACALGHVPIDGTFTADGADAEVLRLRAPECGTALLDATVPPSQRPALGAMGFRRVECVGPASTVGADL